MLQIYFFSSVSIRINVVIKFFFSKFWDFFSLGKNFGGDLIGDFQGENL